MATLQQVADRAGVSIATVSKVLSNTPYFTEETRDKVMRAVVELGYVPNLAARALSSGKTHVIAVVFPYIYDMVFTDPLVLHILEGVEAECSARGYNILLSTPRLTAKGPDDNYLQMIHSGYLEGIVALDNVPLTSVVAPARKKGIPAVAIGYHPNLFTVCGSDRLGGTQLMEHVLALGHRHIGIITVPDGTNIALTHRLEGLREAAADYGVSLEDLPRCAGDYSIQSGAACAKTLLETHPALTALICLNDRMALGAMQQAQSMGWRIPDDLTVVGYDDIPMAQYNTPSLTTINQHAPDLGRRATQMLFAVLNNELPDSVVLPTALVIRQSSGAPRN